MISAEVHHNLDGLNAALVEYVQASGKSTTEVLVRQGGKLAFALSNRLRGLTPGKGRITAERIAALKSGGGVYVRPSVKKKVAAKYKLAQSVKTKRTLIASGRKGKHRGSVLRKGKRLNIRALMVQRELALRESGRGFLGYTSRFTRFKRIGESKHLEHFSRYRRLLTKAGLSIRQDLQTLSFNFQPNPSEGLAKPAAQAAMAAAMQEVTADIQTYLVRKELQRLEQSIATKVRRAA